MQQAFQECVECRHKRPAREFYRMRAGVRTKGYRCEACRRLLKEQGKTALRALRGGAPDARDPGRGPDDPLVLATQTDDPQDLEDEPNGFREDEGHRFRWNMWKQYCMAVGETSGGAKYDARFDAEPAERWSNEVVAGLRQGLRLVEAIDRANREPPDGPEDPPEDLFRKEPRHETDRGTNRALHPGRQREAGDRDGDDAPSGPALVAQDRARRDFEKRAGASAPPSAGDAQLPRPAAEEQPGASSATSPGGGRQDTGPTPGPLLGRVLALVAQLVAGTAWDIASRLDDEESSPASVEALLRTEERAGRVRSSGRGRMTRWSVV